MAFTMVALNVVAPFLAGGVSLQGTRRLITVGGQVSAARALYFVYSQADVSSVEGFRQGVAGVLFDIAAPRLVARAEDIVSRLPSRVCGPARCGGGSVSHVEGDSPAELPVVPGAVNFERRPEIVGVLLGVKWESAIVPLQLLPLVMPVTILSPFQHGLQGIGKTHVVLRMHDGVRFCRRRSGSGRIGVQGKPSPGCSDFLVFYLNLRRMLPMVDSKYRGCWPNPRGALERPSVCLCVPDASLHRRCGARAVDGRADRGGIVGYVGTTLVTNRSGVREIVELFRKKTGPGKTE
jgi:hypothetical protein